MRDVATVLVLNYSLWSCGRGIFPCTRLGTFFVFGVDFLGFCGILLSTGYVPIWKCSSFGERVLRACLVLYLNDVGFIFTTSYNSHISLSINALISTNNFSPFSPCFHTNSSFFASNFRFFVTKYPRRRLKSSHAPQNRHFLPRGFRQKYFPKCCKILLNKAKL